MPQAWEGDVMKKEKNTETSEATRARLRMLITLALFAAIAYVSTALIRIPVVNPGFTLSYDPKDIVIVIAGFIYGPIPAVGIVIVDAFLEAEFEGGRHTDRVALITDIENRQE